ncbi:MAG: DNA polymerase IV [Nitrospirae bacterium]|nr:DNA polymerase IV [Nitrospirota bacterium]
MSKIILCADMDAFFASVEQQTNPRLRGKPIGVIGSGGRTVITTASYEARKFGIKTGMNIYEAKKTFPSLIFVVGDNEKYTHTCKELEDIYAQFTPDVEIYSIDEAFLDITTTYHLFGGPEAIGVAIKKMIKERFGINCTIGIGHNILIAKLASDLSKPDGLRWIKPEEVADVLKDLPVKELWGIGSKISEKLSILDIKTCGELARAPASLLRNKFGIYGETLKAMSMGICNRSVQMKPEDAKSIGHSMTLPEDIWEREKIEAYLLMLSEMVGRRARKYGYMGKTVSFIIRYTDFETLVKQTTLSDFTNNTHVILHGALKIIDKIKLKDRIRLLGVSLSSLIKDPKQIPLLEEERKRKYILQAVDYINDKYGDFKITWGSYIVQKRNSCVISPAWRPSGVKNINVK